MKGLVVTLDIDWACEAAIEDTLSTLFDLGVPPTCFTTHRSTVLEGVLDRIEVGLHPYFGVDSSHGGTVDEVVRYVKDLPHNFPAFRCHRFERGNRSMEAMAAAGMEISSNVCSDLAVIPPFPDRYGLLEVPIFLEDGGYLWRGHSLEGFDTLHRALEGSGEWGVLLIHPMHFALNTPHFAYMSDIKRSLSRSEWQGLSKAKLARWRWQGRGIRDLLVDLLKGAPAFCSLGRLAQGLHSPLS